MVRVRRLSLSAEPKLTGGIDSRRLRAASRAWNL